MAKTNSAKTVFSTCKILSDQIMISQKRNSIVSPDKNVSACKKVKTKKVSPLVLLYCNEGWRKQILSKLELPLGTILNF